MSPETDPLEASPDVRAPEPTESGFRSGFVALCGRPNVGKSTLLNALIGEDLAVATRFPQTTRERMLGVWDTPEFQAVLVDTPGIHHARSALNRYMVHEAIRGARDVDLVLLLAEVPWLASDAAAEQWVPGSGATAALEQLAELARPIVLVLTKVDQLRDDRHLMPVVQRWRDLYDFVATVPVSAQEGQGLDALRDVVFSALGEGPRYYADGQLSDRDMRWHVAELIRGQVFEHLGDELPYSCAVCIDTFKERKDKDHIRASIHVERESQKGIVIGKGGRTIKRISAASRAKVEELSGRPCDLFVDVRVTRNWTKDPKKLETFGYREDDAS